MFYLMKVFLLLIIFKLIKIPYKNKEELINIAFKKGFEKLNSKILLEKDYLKTKNISLKNIKNLVSHYQIQKINEEILIKILRLINLYFKRDKMYNFYNQNNIKYSDVSGKILKIFQFFIK